MARKYRKKIEIEEVSSFDLDLAPMLALMVTLIPILLLSTVFVQVVVIETPLPQVVQEALNQDRNKKDRDILVLVEMNTKQGFDIKVTIDGKTKESFKIPNAEGKLDFDRLHVKLVTIKQSYPKIFRLDLSPAEGVAYADIVKVMDSARELNKEDGNIRLPGRAGGEVVETKLMFPDVVFANVVEG